jgi:hypothetical protein
MALGLGLGLPIAGTYVQAQNALTSTGFYQDCESLESLLFQLFWVEYQSKIQKRVVLAEQWIKNLVLNQTLNL